MRFRQVHLDFHTSEKIPAIGEKFDAKQFQQALLAGHVDSITVFSKCHHGWAYHPSEANIMHPNLKFDLLGEQIKAAHEIGVKTPVYLSAGLDEKVAVEHSEWLLRRPDESTTWATDFSHPGYHRFCFNTPYLDILLEQIKEVCKNYDADGIFLDIVDIQPCYCQQCRQTLIAEGKDPFDPQEALELANRVYANYTRRVRETIDSIKPGLPVFHNASHLTRGRRDWAHMNSHLELESLPTGGWGYDNFPMSAAYARTLDMEYLGMTGKFHTSWGEFGGFKHPNAIRYEVALSVALGAKCSVGDQLSPDGEMDMATYELIGAGYRELEEKEEWLTDVQFVADIALLSDESIKPVREEEKRRDTGAGRILLEGNYLFDVIDTEADFSHYRVLILPDYFPLTQSLREKLKAFTKAGGKLLASGTSCLEDGKFLFDFGANYCKTSDYNPMYFRPDFRMTDLGETAFICYGQAEIVEKSETGIQLGQLENPYFNRERAHFCSHKHAPNSGEYAGVAVTQGADGIYIAWSVFSEYANMGNLSAKRTVQYALDTLLGENKTLRTTLPAQGVTTLTRQEKENRLIHHLLYASPVKRGSIEVIEDILPVYDVQAELTLAQKVRRIYLAPSMEEIAFTQENGRVTYTVPKLECHQMVVLDLA